MEMADQLDDRAIVVGIGSYPLFSSDGRTANNLQGPVRDAQEMASWLSQTARAKVVLITSTGRPGEAWQVAERRPCRADIEHEFDQYVSQGFLAPTRRIGRRLYIYMAGHGFCPEPRHMSLITADALANISIPNIQATSWVDWFAVQTYFDEFVLWMDCCATQTYDYEGGKPMLKRLASRPEGRGKVFMAFAARPTRVAFEGPVGPSGQIRGLFTHKLLLGLRGAAASGNVVTTSSLMAYFRNSSVIVGSQPVANPEAARLEPFFPEADDMFLADVSDALPEYKLAVPLPDNAEIRVWNTTGQPIPIRAVVSQGVARVKLGIGIYKAESAGFSRLFEISSGTDSHAEVRFA